MNVEPIYELIRPKEVYLLYKDDKGIVYVGNDGGKAFVARAPYPPESE